MDILLEKLAAMGITLTVTKNDILAEFEEQGSLQPVDVHSLPYPGIATDYMPFLVTMLSVAKGISLASENLFPGRFRYIDELIRMGANIRLEGHHIAIKGVDCLSAARVRAPDLRGGAALVLAGLTAQGETTVEDIFHIDRGYEYFDKKLAMLGADVQRIKR
jgi:UDP-N-acetylglucosamine 1-carboxyvinyltransferase